MNLKIRSDECKNSQCLLPTWWKLLELHAVTPSGRGGRLDLFVKNIYARTRFAFGQEAKVYQIWLAYSKKYNEMDKNTILGDLELKMAFELVKNAPCGAHKLVLRARS